METSALFLFQRVANNQIPHSAIRYLDAGSRSFFERVQDLWFAPKSIESTDLYKHLGVLLVKRYAPTGGDLVNRRCGLTIANIRRTLDSLTRFERMTRRLEAIHLFAFLFFLTLSARRAFARKTSWPACGIAVMVYLSLILSPAMLQRYNRLRLYAAIRHMAAKQ